MRIITDESLDFYNYSLVQVGLDLYGFEEWKDPARLVHFTDLMSGVICTKEKASPPEPRCL